MYSNRDSVCVQPLGQMPRLNDVEEALRIKAEIVKEDVRRQYHAVSALHDIFLSITTDKVRFTTEQKKLLGELFAVAVR